VGSYQGAFRGKGVWCKGVALLVLGLAVVALVGRQELVRAAHASTTSASELDCSGAGWQQRRGTAALSRISYPWQQLGFRVQFLPARADYLGYTNFPDRRIEVYVQGCPEESPALLAHVIAHEIGHAVDFRYGNADRRARWLSLRALPVHTPWYGNALSADFRTPAGDFAETFAFSVAGPVGYRSELGSAPSAAQLVALQPLFAR
jgi:hypothetical protein